jgi:predicted short-subunit dehydrogenase-like oxidoreductase (DUF2520 family)
MNIVLIGTGNVAWHLAHALSATNHKIIQVYGRNAANAASIASIANCSSTNNAQNILPNAEAYILAVSDSSIEQVASLKAIQNNFLIHVAGSVAASVLEPYTSQAAVMYPLQSFTQGRKLDYAQIPFFIEANKPEALAKVQQLARSVSTNVIEMSAEERKTLHLSAVFASNYVNHFFTIAETLLNEKGLDFDILKPLIHETVSKAMSMKPLDAQTGPARRHNTNILNSHNQMLSNHPLWQKIYTFVANSIMNMYKK